MDLTPIPIPPEKIITDDEIISGLEKEFDDNIKIIKESPIIAEITYKSKLMYKRIELNKDTDLVGAVLYKAGNIDYIFPKTISESEIINRIKQMFIDVQNYSTLPVLESLPGADDGFKQVLDKLIKLIIDPTKEVVWTSLDELKRIIIVEDNVSVPNQSYKITGNISLDETLSSNFPLLSYTGSKLSVDVEITDDTGSNFLTYPLEFNNAVAESNTPLLKLFLNYITKRILRLDPNDIKNELISHSQRLDSNSKMKMTIKIHS